MEKNRNGKTITRVLIELPVLYALVVTGYLLEWLVTLPMLIDCEWASIRKNGGFPAGLLRTRPNRFRRVNGSCPPNEKEESSP